MNYADIVRSGSAVGGRGDGKFAAIRDAVNKMIPDKLGEVVPLSEITKKVEKIAKLASSQEAYNYASNALKSDARFLRIRLANKRIVMMRVNGDKAFAEGALKELEKAGRLHPEQGSLKGTQE